MSCIPCQQKVSQQAQSVVNTVVNNPVPLPNQPEYVNDVRSLDVAYTNENDSVTIYVLINGMKPGAKKGDYDPAHFTFEFGCLTDVNGCKEMTRPNTWSAKHPFKKYYSFGVSVRRRADSQLLRMLQYTM